MRKPPSPKPAAPRRSSADAHTSDVAPFTPVVTRIRHDGWTPEKQHDFIHALAESGCVAEAAAAVGMNPRGAYRLRARTDASAFRQSWDIALDFAIRRLSDAAFSRALHGVSNPIFFQGEQIGERTRYDERLTMFLLRYRDPTRYGAWLDGMEARRHPDGAALVLAHALNTLMDSAYDTPPAPADDRDDAAHAPVIGRALNLGREAPPDAPPDDDDYVDPLPHIRAALRAKMAEIDAQQADTDGREASWTSPLVTRTPRRE